MVISLLNHKGGCGKSTLAVHLAVWLHDRGYTTAVVNADEQATPTQWLQKCEPRILVKHITETRQGSGRLVGEAIAELGQLSQFVIVDAPPKLHENAMAAMFCADLILCPLKASRLDVGDTVQFIEGWKKTCATANRRIPARLVLNMAKAGTNNFRMALETLPLLGIPFCDQVIGDRTAYLDAPNYGSTVTRMAQHKQFKKSAAQAAVEIEALFTEALKAHAAEAHQHAA